MTREKYFLFIITELTEYLVFSELFTPENKAHLCCE